MNGICCSSWRQWLPWLQYSYNDHGNTADNQLLVLGVKQWGSAGVYWSISCLLISMCVCGAPACVCVWWCQVFLSVLISFSWCVGQVAMCSIVLPSSSVDHHNILFTHCSEHSEAADTLLAQDMEHCVCAGILYWTRCWYTITLYNTT